jgi:hypothetical protein
MTTLERLNYKWGSVNREYCGNMLLQTNRSIEEMKQFHTNMTVMEMKQKVVIIQGKHLDIFKSLQTNTLFFKYSLELVQILFKLHLIYRRYKKNRIKRIMKIQNIITVQPLQDIILSYD